MITVYVNGNEIIPYESVEYVESPDCGMTSAAIHMAESKKVHSLLSPEAKRFTEGYIAYLELKEFMSGIVDDNDDSPTPGPTRKTM